MIQFQGDSIVGISNEQLRIVNLMKVNYDECKSTLDWVIQYSNQNQEIYASLDSLYLKSRNNLDSLLKSSEIRESIIKSLTDSNNKLKKENIKVKRLFYFSSGGSLVLLILLLL